jgi:selenocysteine lyase/cysteine desulfurase
MRVVVIGGTGHIGTYLVPKLVETGYQVISVSRQQREPYQPHAACKAVQHVTLDRAAVEEAGIFVWDGNYYALAVTERLGVEESGGIVRVGIAHYNTAAEVDRLLAVVKDLTLHS